MKLQRCETYVFTYLYNPVTGFVQLKMSLRARSSAGARLNFYGKHKDVYGFLAQACDEGFLQKEAASVTFISDRPRKVPIPNFCNI